MSKDPKKIYKVLVVYVKCLIRIKFRFLHTWHLFWLSFFCIIWLWKARKSKNIFPWNLYFLISRKLVKSNMNFYCKNTKTKITKKSKNWDSHATEKDDISPANYFFKIGPPQLCLPPITLFLVNRYFFAIKLHIVVTRQSNFKDTIK